MSQWITWILLTNITCHLHPMAWPSASAHLRRSIAWSLSTCSLRPSMRTCASGSSGSWDVQMKVGMTIKASENLKKPEAPGDYHPTSQSSPIPLPTFITFIRPCPSSSSPFLEKRPAWVEPKDHHSPGHRRPGRLGHQYSQARLLRRRVVRPPWLSSKGSDSAPSLGCLTVLTHSTGEKTGDFWGELVVVESSGL